MDIIGIDKLIEITARFPIVYPLKRAVYKLLKPKTSWLYTYLASNPKYCYYSIKFEI